MRRMLRSLLEPLLQPLPLAGLLTILTVGYSLRFAERAHQPGALLLLGVFLLLFLVLQLLPEARRLPQHLVLLAMPPVILALNGLSMRVGATQVLLVIWAACAFAVWRPRTAAWRNAPCQANHASRGKGASGCDQSSSVWSWQWWRWAVRRTAATSSMTWSAARRQRST